MAPQLEINFLESMRELCAYFETKCKEADLSGKLLTGRLTYSFSTNKTTAYTEICHIINFTKDKFEITDLLNFICLAFIEFNKRDLSGAQLHRDQKNNCIVHLLDRLVQGRISCFNSSIDDDSLDQLRIVHSKLFSPFLVQSVNAPSPFSSNFVSQPTSSDVTQVSPHNNGGTLSETEKTRKIDNILYDRQNTRLRFLFNKLIRYKSHVSIIEIHKTNGTTPNSLFFNRFPKPFFPYNAEFIEKYNDLIEKFQNETLTMISDTLDGEIIKINSEINAYKATFDQKYPNSLFKFSEVVDRGTKLEEKFLENRILSNTKRAQRCEKRRLSVRTRTFNSRNTDSSFGTNISTYSTDTREGTNEIRPPHVGPPIRSGRSPAATMRQDRVNNYLKERRYIPNRNDRRDRSSSRHSRVFDQYRNYNNHNHDDYRCRSINHDSFNRERYNNTNNNYMSNNNNNENIRSNRSRNLNRNVHYSDQNR